MLNMYQLWLDDLYPRAKFADGLAMIEKLGHSKNIQLQRKAWIDEGKPKHNTDLDRLDKSASPSGEPNEHGTDRMNDFQPGNAADEGALPGREDGSEVPVRTEDLNNTHGDEEPDDDELDALLAESTGLTNVRLPAALPVRKTMAVESDPFADDMEEMEGW
jgi:replication fork protection complex subunit Csm3/Swi3